MEAHSGRWAAPPRFFDTLLRQIGATAPRGGQVECIRTVTAIHIGSERAKVYSGPIWMNPMRRTVWITLLLLTAPVTAFARAPDIAISGLFNGAALLTINGQPKMLRVGEPAYAGVRLISADPHGAVVEVNGERRPLRLSEQIGDRFVPRERARATIVPDARQQYLTQGSINGLSVSMLVDTGATAIAMSETEARRLGIDFRYRGEESMVTTASHQVRAYRVVLEQVTVGEITVHQVEAAILEGDLPEQILLGMSFLQHVELSERQGMLELVEK